MSLVFDVQPRVRPVKSPFIVKEVRAFVIDKAVEEAAGGGADCHSQVRRARLRAPASVWAIPTRRARSMNAR